MISASTRRIVLRVTVSLSLLVLLGVVLDASEVMARLADLRPGWVVAALALSIVQIVVSAWRWRYTAARLGIELPVRDAVAEYYLAAFLNQVLPGGVLGDVSRAWRHSRVESGDGGRLRSVHAVILERTSGQAVMTAVAVVAGAFLLASGGSSRSEAAVVVPAAPAVPGGPAATVSWGVFLAGGVAVTALLLVLLRTRLRRAARFPATGRLLADARTALLGSALPVQAGLSLAIVASYVAVFVLGARALGVETSIGALVVLVPPVLVTMLLPVSVAGWGVREGAAALLWGAVGLTASDGVAISVTYGLLVLVSSLPGAVVLAFSPTSSGDPDRRADRFPDGNGAPPVGAPRRASPPPGG